LIKATFFLPGNWRLPSFAPDDYRANRSLPIKAHKLVFRLARNLKKGKFAHTNLPTLVILDPKDELISLNRLKQIADKYALNRYRFLQLSPEGGAKKKNYHHLIVDERSLGSENWNLLLTEIRRFLFS
jgi:hypothetical protein